MILTLMRHGQTDYNKNLMIQGQIDIPLNQTGRKQAKEAGTLLKEQKAMFDYIAASPLERAYVTARVVARTLKHQKPILLLEDFIERDFGFVDGTTIKESWPIIMAPNFRHPEYEDDEQLVKRVVKAAFDLEKMLGDTTVLVVCHSHVIKSLLVHADPNNYSFPKTLIEHAKAYPFEVQDGVIKIL